MIKIIKNAKHDFKMLKFLILHDPKYRYKLYLTTTILFALIGIIWNFDFAKLEPLLTVPTKAQALLRILLTIVTILLFLISAFLFTLHFYKKYKDPKKLTKEEREKFNKYFNIKKEVTFRWI